MIRLDAVRIHHKGAQDVPPLTLEIGHGEAVALISRTGHGKTMLLETIAGLRPPASGRVLRGDPAAASPHHLPRIGYAPADAAAWPVMRADEFLETVGLSAGLTGKPLRLAVTRGLTFAHLGQNCDYRIDRLSDGQRKRLLLAATLLHDPDLLVLDDPLRSLDAPGRADVEQVIADLALAGGTIVAALNDGVIGTCWSRVLLLEHGRVFDSKRGLPHADSAWPTWSVAPLAAWQHRLNHPMSEG